MNFHELQSGKVIALGQYRMKDMKRKQFFFLQFFSYKLIFPTWSIIFFLFPQSYHQSVIEEHAANCGEEVYVWNV